MMKNKTVGKSTKMNSPANGAANGTHEVEVALGEVRQGTFTRGQIESVEVDDADLVWMDDADWGEIPPKASFPVQLHITKVERGQIEPIEIDDVDLDGFGPDSLEALSPIASYDAILEFEGTVTQGQFAPVDLDETDLELFN